MEILVVLSFLLFLLLLIPAVGHGIWVVLRWIIRQLADTPTPKPEVVDPDVARCLACRAVFPPHKMFCGHCGARRPVGVVVELLKDLAATERQVERFRRSGVISAAAYEEFKEK